MLLLLRKWRGDGDLRRQAHGVLRHRWEHLMHQICQERVTLLVGRVEMVDLSVWIDDEYSTEVYTDCSVRDSIGVPVSKSTVVGVPLIGEQIPDVIKRSYLEDLGLSLDDLSLERPEQSVWAHNHGTIRHDKALVLHDTLDIIARRVCLANGPRSQVEELVPVGFDCGVQLGDSFVGPILAESG